MTRIDQLDQLTEYFGGDLQQVVDNIVQAMSNSDFNEIYEYICRMWSFGIEED